MLSGLRCYRSRITPRILPNSACCVLTKSQFHSRSNLLTVNGLQNTYRFNSVRHEAGTHWGQHFTEYASKTSFFESITQSEVVYAVQDKLINFHDYSGLPWWAVIMLSTVALRTAILPLAIHQQYVLAKSECMFKELDTTVKNEITAEVNKLSDTENWNSKKLEREYCNRMRDKRTELYQKYNCHPMKNISLILIQIPLWTAMSAALRNIVSMLPIQDGPAITAFLEMQVSGFWFIKDLTTPDTTFVLPFILCLTNIIIMEINKTSRINKYSRLRSVIIVLGQSVCILTMPITASVPKALALYWITSAFYGLLQNLLFLSPRVRALLRIPHTDTLRKKPFQRIRNKYKSIFYFFKY